jgi:hypothetical protein
MVLYAAGIAALTKGRYDVLKLLLDDAIAKSNYNQDPIGSILGSGFCFWHDAAQVLHAGANRKTPGSDWMAERLRPILSEILGSDIEFDDVFDELELIIALVVANQSGRPVIGRFGWRQSFSRGQHLNWYQRLTKEIEELGIQQPLLRAGMFNKDPEKLKQALQAVGQLSAKVAW